MSPHRTRCEPDVALVTGFSVHPDEQAALDRGIDGFRFFQFALGHFYRSGEHKPGRADIWQQYLANRDQIIAEDVRSRRDPADQVVPVKLPVRVQDP